MQRSPTAEQEFRSWKGLEVKSAGVLDYAVTPLTRELCTWADQIFVMEEYHEEKLLRLCAGLDNIAGKVIVLDIPDMYFGGDPVLVQLLNEKVPQHFPAKIIEKNRLLHAI